MLERITNNRLHTRTTNKQTTQQRVGTSLSSTNRLITKAARTWFVSGWKRLGRVASLRSSGRLLLWCNWRCFNKEGGENEHERTTRQFNQNADREAAMPQDPWPWMRLASAEEKIRQLMYGTSYQHLGGILTAQS